MTLSSCVTVIILRPQSFLWAKGGNGFEHSGLFLPKMGKGSYLLQQFAGNHVSLSGIWVSISDAIKLADIFDTVDTPILLTKTKRSHRAMEDRYHEIAPERIRNEWQDRR